MPEGVSLDIVRDALGMPQSVTFDGKTYTITDQGNNTYLIDGPGDEDVTVGFDIFGQIARYERGEEKTQISRDADGRPVKIVASGQTTTIDYSEENPNLPRRIQVGENSLEINNINDKGLPEEVAVNGTSGQVKLDAQYHGNGTPLAVTATPAGGEETKTEYDEHGALVMLQRPMEDPIVYNRNQWGTVESMDYAGTNYPIFGSRNDLNWSLSNGVNLTLNDWGQLITVAKQGLAAKTITYDGQGRLKDIKIGETVETVVTYDGPKVDTVDHAGVTETYNRDEMGRVTSVTVNDTMVAKAGDTNGTWTYKDDGSGRVATYLDRNGALQRYNYDKAGRLTEIAIEQGPTLHYAYNDNGLLETVQSGAMRADFSNYDKGVPSTITWGDPDAAVQTFTVSKTAEGRIDRIESSDGAFLLDLDWVQETDGSDVWLVDRLEKQADGFGEVWAPTYTAEKRLDTVTITRTTGQVITETYNVDTKRLLGGLTRVVDGVTVLDASNTSDASAANIRNTVLADATSSVNWTATYDSSVGNLTQLSASDGTAVDMNYDSSRRITSITHPVPGGSLTYTYSYDLDNRRIKAEAPVDNSGTWTTTERVYAFQGSRVIAIGDMDASSTITWTHAIGWGPMGPVFIDDLTSAGNDYYLFTDHLGTPFGHHNPATDTTYHSPTNPWGELLATHPAPTPHYTAQGAVATSGAGGPAFTLPPDATHATSPLGLAGHLYDHHTGLVYMHNRHYHPRLGHFTTPDYRAPDIYDPTTYTEPYAYAGGNPILFYDPNGLTKTGKRLRAWLKSIEHSIDEAVEIIVADEPSFIVGLLEKPLLTVGAIGSAAFSGVEGAVATADTAITAVGMITVGVIDEDIGMAYAMELEGTEKAVKGAMSFVKNEYMAYYNDPYGRMEVYVSAIKSATQTAISGSRYEKYKQDKAVTSLALDVAFGSKGTRSAAKASLKGGKSFQLTDDILLDMNPGVVKEKHFDKMRKAFEQLPDADPEKILAKIRNGEQVTPKDLGLKTIADDDELSWLWQANLKSMVANARFSGNNLTRYLDAQASGAKISKEMAESAWKSVRRNFSTFTEEYGVDVLGKEIHHWNFKKENFPDIVIDPRHLVVAPTREVHELMHVLFTSTSNIFHGPTKAKHRIFVPRDYLPFFRRKNK